MDAQLLGAIAVAICLVVATAIFFLRGSSNGSTSKPAAAVAAPVSKEPEKKAEDAPAGKMTVYFGSQTGTAEGFAEQVKKEASGQGFDCSVVDLDDFDAEAFIESRLAVVLVATYGEGEPTDNAADFFKWLKTSKKEMDPSGEKLLGVLSFAVFGLGNRQYEHFNKVGKDVDDFLSVLGGKRVYDLGLGDDDGTLEDDFDAWKEKLWPALRAQFHPNANDDDANKVAKKTPSAADLAALASLATPDLPFTLELLPASARAANALVAPGPAPAHAQASTKHFFTAPRIKVMENRELRGPLDGGSTRHIEFEVQGVENLSTYATADNLAVLPENDPDAVEALAKAMGYDLDRSFTLKPNGKTAFKPAFPTPCTVREALTCFIDLHGLPRRTSLKDWAPFCSDPDHAAALMSMSGKTPVGKAKFTSEVESQHKSLVELLTQDFASCKVPLGALLHLAPHLQPRYYTISSSNKAHPKRIHATVAVLAQPKGSGNGMLQGVCSTFLQRLEPPLTVGGKKADALDKTNGSSSSSSSYKVASEPRPPRPWPSCRAFVRPSTFRLPPSLATPIVLVGPGTGIAPMRALLYERQHWVQQQQGGNGSDASVGPAVLYFGCKHQDCDFLYQDELSAFQADGTLSKLHLAISRPNFTSGGAPGNKVYVQHLLGQEANSEELWDLIDGRGGHLYVCGGTAMGADVQAALLKVVAGRITGGGSAANYVANLKAQGRYVQELWA